MAPAPTKVKTKVVVKTPAAAPPEIKKKVEPPKLEEISSNGKAYQYDFANISLL